MAVAAGGVESLSVSSGWRQLLDALRRGPVVSVSMIGIIVLAALFAPLVAPYHPNDQSLDDRLSPPMWQEGGTFGHILGTDKLGRDILSRLIYGARVSLIIAGAVLAISGISGLVIGIVAGYFGGRVDAVLMRIVDAFIAMPGILIALLFAATLGGGMITLTIAIALFRWSTFARVVRGEVLSLREEDFVALAVVHGCSPLRIMVVHILPGVMSTWAVLATLNAGGIIITEASLSFLGAGIPPPTASWGQMVSEGRTFIATAWWIAIMPGAAITVVVLAFNLFGDWLRDFLDPKLRALQ
ncbi:MAG: peptide ABC transporter permease [Chloroflexi bacterium]|nr:peptide ABC transporter permease [Chloroflexota bacterium]